MKKRYLKLVRRAFRSMRHPRMRHRPWWQAVTKPVSDRALWIPCRDTVANGLAIGLFFAMLLMPFQMLAAALVAMRARANIPFAMAACWVTNPLTLGPILWAQCALGHWMRTTLGVPMPHFISRDVFTIPDVGTVNSASFLLGMSTSSLVVALCAYPLTHLFSAMMPHHLPVRKKRGKPREIKNPAWQSDDHDEP